ncbi:agamous-like MADS-box protein AGL61 [Primulina eburnea]|uniref:agamous-like MADS-box protein AGL61 n=1 Tax=Primulina eburnea TaxID=1245227 RepID=UPI003C6CBA22
MNVPEDQIVEVMDVLNKKKRKDRRVGIKLIEDRGELNTTFTKRRQGLFNKITDFCQKFDAQAGFIAFSMSGNLYVGGDPEFNPLLKRYLADPSSSVAKKGTAAVAETLLLCGSEIPEKPALTDMENRINEALGKGPPAWDMILENLGFGQLQEIEKALQVVKTKIAARDVMTN